MPNPSSDCTPNCAASASSASAGSNSHPSRGVKSAPVVAARRSATDSPATAAPATTAAAISTSRGASRASTASASPVAQRMRRNSPVDRSAAAIPTSSPTDCTAQRKLLRVTSSRSSLNAAPGVIVSTTARFTIPFANFGSSICSQIATRNPCCTSRRRYSEAAFTGIPASGTSAAPPLLREVSVRPSARDAVSASS